MIPSIVTRELPTKAQVEIYRRGINQTKLASELGIAMPYLNDILAGHRGARALRKWAPKIAEATGIPIEELFPGLVMGDGGDGSH